MTAEKLDAFHFESGRQSLTRQILAMGREILLVGRNGRGYSPQWWPTSDTFRLGKQSNLLIADNQTRNFNAFRLSEKREFVLQNMGSLYTRGGDVESIKVIREFLFFLGHDQYESNYLSRRAWHAH